MMQPDNLPDALREIARLQASLDIERQIPLGRYAFYHRHLALSYVRRVDPALHHEASSFASEEIDRDGGRSFRDVVEALEQQRDALLAVCRMIACDPFPYDGDGQPVRDERTEAWIAIQRDAQAAGKDTATYIRDAAKAVLGNAHDER